MDSDKKLLICSGDGGHDMLLFDREIGDAVFHFEFRYVKIEGKTGYNSGAYIRNSKDGSIWHQAQMGDASGGFLFGRPVVSDEPSARFSLSKLVTNPRVKPAGEWNTMELTAAGNLLTLWVNGAVTCKFVDCQNPKGHLGLEGEGFHIEFRNLNEGTARKRGVRENCWPPSAPTGHQTTAQGSTLGRTNTNAPSPERAAPCGAMVLKSTITDIFA